MTSDATFLQIAGVTRWCVARGRPVHILGPVSLDVARGEFLSLIGPSGCGKSTLLGIVAGLVPATSGVVTLEGRPVMGPGLDRGVVFQGHALLPWLTALENVVFALDATMRGATRAEKERVARRYLDLVKLGHAADRRPGQLSGGMKQRVGIARAFAVRPKVLLLDEPFGALDPVTRARLQDALLALWAAQRTTVLLVTHDVDEALYLSDRIVVMSHGPGARVRADIPVRLGRPRRRDALLEDPEYRRLRQRIVAMLGPDAGAAGDLAGD